MQIVLEVDLCKVESVQIEIFSRLNSGHISSASDSTAAPPTENQGTTVETEQDEPDEEAQARVRLAEVKALKDELEKQQKEAAEEIECVERIIEKCEEKKREESRKEYIRGTRGDLTVMHTTNDEEATKFFDKFCVSTVRVV